MNRTGVTLHIEALQANHHLSSKCASPKVLHYSEGAIRYMIVEDVMRLHLRKPTIEAR